MLHYLWVREAYTLEDMEVEASKLYPDIAVITADDYFKKLLADSQA